MYVDGDVVDVDLRRVLEGPVPVVARRKEVLSDMALIVCMPSQLHTVVDTDKVAESLLRKSDKTCGGRDNLRFILCKRPLTKTGLNQL